MVHQGQRLTFGVEAGHHRLGVHTPLDGLQGHPATDRLLLLGEEDLAHTACTEFLEDPVRAESLRVGLGVRGRFDNGRATGVCEHRLDYGAKLRVLSTGFIQKSRPPPMIQRHGSQEQLPRSMSPGGTHAATSAAHSASIGISPATWSVTPWPVFFGNQ
jgi:hypothetical protein